MKPLIFSLPFRDVPTSAVVLWNLCRCSDWSQEMVPALVDTIKELGLVLVADTSNEQTDPDNATTKGWSCMPEGVNGILKDNGILRFHDTIDM